MLQSATTTDAAAAAAAATLLEHELSAKQQYYSRDKVAKLDLHEWVMSVPITQRKRIQYQNQRKHWFQFSDRSGCWSQVMELMLA